MQRWLNATANSWNGLKSCFATEAAFREELLLLLVAIPAALVLTPDAWKRVALLAPIFLLLVVELLNTAIEKLCDKAHPEPDDAIGRVKDMSSAAIGLTLLGTAIIWLIAIVEFI